eukprot:TRINITY_DN1473_c0_g1_i1.p2 TRINITY_DN1473_c0_g1~~TRINITY_DN1473_c0_g1_i1.p2  ORF type:complete len:123 (+),score=14.35 TRINITY_DN1473_c0_g1_i1:26-370(+)
MSGVQLDEEKPNVLKNTMGKLIDQKKNYSKALKVAGILSGLGTAIVGFTSFFVVTGRLPLIEIYLIILGLITMVALVPFPKAWHKLSKKWAPFLHTWRGRGGFLILFCCFVFIF